MNASDDRIKEVLEHYYKHGMQNTLETFGISHADTIRRYESALGSRGLEINEAKRSAVLQRIADTYSDYELKAIAKGGRVTAGATKTPTINFSGEEVLFGFLTDTHLGSVYTDPEYVHAAFREFERQGVDFICHAGDITEGMSNRPGHVYELSHIGYAQQKKHAIEVLGSAPAPLYMIDGNHDRWYIKSNGAIIVEDIADAIPQATFLGHDEGDMNIGNATIRMWHGEDGSSYAISYRVQKVIESFTGGDKPNILLLGHVHKQGYFFERHIHAISGGSIQKQSKWMRGKRLQAHTGFWIVKAVLNDKGVARIRTEWFPFYA